MIITFLGHRSLYNVGDLLERVQNTIVENVGPNDDTVFYCGGYGDFDNLCAKACRFIKEKRPNCEVVFVMPYIPDLQKEKRKSLMTSDLYDSTLYPPLENVPPKFAISKRNEWMVMQADLIIAYVEHSFGGAYKGLEYARRKKKRIVNLAEEKR